MDAYDDLDNDLKEGSYNPLKNICREPDYEERCRNMLCMMLGEASAAFEQLPLLCRHRHFIGIYYMMECGSVTESFRSKKKRRQQKTNKTGKNKRLENEQKSI